MDIVDEINLEEIDDYLNSFKMNVMGSSTQSKLGPPPYKKSKTLLRKELKQEDLEAAQLNRKRSKPATNNLAKPKETLEEDIDFQGTKEKCGKSLLQIEEQKED